MIKGYQNDKSYSGPELRSRADRGANSSPGISHIESVKSTPPKTIFPLIEDEDEKTTRDNASNEDRWASRFLNSQA